MNVDSAFLERAASNPAFATIAREALENDRRALGLPSPTTKDSELALSDAIAFLKSQPVTPLDGRRMILGHEIEGASSPVTAIAGSRRSRIVGVSFANRELHVYQITTESRVAHASLSPDVAMQAIAVAPKENGIYAFGPRSFQHLALDVGYPEATLSSLFRPVHYEGFEEPVHAWQSTGGTDDFEPKLGLWPLVFGTLKATFYCMLFAAPLALLAAVFTSEFVSPRARPLIKSVIEMMAGLPSVVLGFLAALVIAPIVQGGLAATLSILLCIPIAFMLGARTWQFLRTDTAVRLKGMPKLAFIASGLIGGVLMGIAIGPLWERAFFGGDLIAWLDGGAGSAIAGWAFLLLPVSLLLATLFMTRVIGPVIRNASTTWSRAQCAAVDLVRAVGSIAIVLLLMFGIGAIMASIAGDPRGGFLGSYSQRNALIVGFVMGFAVIPIIYTLTEDALSAVPRALREGSLGCGATEWQTASRIVIPTAMSGIFSALMIGLGRAVGETMIVLMAAGNTPLISRNGFEGMRTLSANIAVEMPEAVKDSTHFRTLFLAGFVLFLMTFLINTFAEVVRRRFRSRAASL